MVRGGGETGDCELCEACRGGPEACLVFGGGKGGSNMLAVLGRYCVTVTAGGGARGVEEIGAGGGGTETVEGAYVVVWEAAPYE